MCAARTLVVHPPVSIARDFIDYPYLANLGSVQLVAVLETVPAVSSQTDSTVYVDAFALPSSSLTFDRSDGRGLLGAPLADVVAAIEHGVGDSDIDFVVVAYTPFHRPPNRDDLLAELLAYVRRRWPDAPVVLADAYQSGQHYIEAGEGVIAAYPEVDAYLKYEAEVTLAKLVSAYRETGARPHGVIRGEQPQNLDALPFPAWHRIDLPAYFRFHDRVVQNLGRPQWAFPISGGSLPLVTSRGCPFTCIHCSSNPDTPAGKPKTQRRYSPERLQQYLRYLAEFSPPKLHALDELINVNERHFDTFLATIAELDLKFEVPNGMRADYVEPRHLAHMRGRMTTLSISAESGCQEVLDTIVRKRLDLQSIVDATEAAHRAEVSCLVHYIIGFPGETAEQINETLNFALDLWDRFGAYPAVQYATPLPGTPLAQAAQKLPHNSLPIVDDWGPYFQQAPSLSSQVPTEHLRQFMWTFRKRLDASRGPKKLVMNVTYVCNNHCTFCATGTRTQIDGHPTRQREQLVKYRKLGVHMVDFDGGEPTLNPELIPLIRYARKIGYTRVNVTTNGRRCVYPKFATALTNSGLTTLLFSVHGPNPKVHAQHVGVAEAFAQTTEGIRNCLAAARPGVELGMNITITKQNHELLPEVAQLCWDLGLKWLNLQFLTPFGRATSWVAPDTQHAADIAMSVMDNWGDRMKFQVINLPFCFMPGYEQHMQGDLAKLERHMVFVNNETVNLSEYLAARRTRKPQCFTCPHACFCGGFYEMDEVPEPPWLIAPEDLLRSIDNPRRHESVPAGFHENVARRLATKSPSDAS